MKRETRKRITNTKKKQQENVLQMKRKTSKRIINEKKNTKMFLPSIDVFKLVYRKCYAQMYSHAYIYLSTFQFNSHLLCDQLKTGYA